MSAVPSLQRVNNMPVADNSFFGKIKNNMIVRLAKRVATAALSIALTPFEWIYTKFQNRNIIEVNNTSLIQSMILEESQDNLQKKLEEEIDPLFPGISLARSQRVNISAQNEDCSKKNATDYKEILSATNQIIGIIPGDACKEIIESSLQFALENEDLGILQQALTLILNREEKGESLGEEFVDECFNKCNDNYRWARVCLSDARKKLQALKQGEV